jgi:hypothetical protein
MASILMPIEINVKPDAALLALVPMSALVLVQAMSDGAEVTEDWAAVGAAISDRLAELRATQMEVAARAKISLTTLRELQHNINPRRRRPQTLAALSEALGWPTGHLSAILHGENSAPPAEDEREDPIMASLRSVELELTELKARVAQIERQLSAEDA